MCHGQATTRSGRSKAFWLPKTQSEGAEHLVVRTLPSPFDSHRNLDYRMHTMLQKTLLTLSASAMSALMAAVLATTPAIASQRQVTLRRLTEGANACTATGARNIYRQSCFRNRAGDLHGIGDRDVWGHWGNYYGPMVFAP
jgi:hypothetical protein